MSPKGNILIALAVAALAAPAVASAQQAYGQPQESQSYGQPQADYGPPEMGPQGYGQDQGDQNGQRMQGKQNHGRRAQTSVYPQFRSLERHIRRTVREERKSNTIAKRDAHRLMAQLKQIQAEEVSLYNQHGMNLPSDTQSRIQGELTQLAQAVDRSRAQQGPGQGYEGQQ